MGKKKRQRKKNDRYLYAWFDKAGEISIYMVTEKWWKKHRAMVHGVWLWEVIKKKSKVGKVDTNLCKI